NRERRIPARQCARRPRDRDARISNARETSLDCRGVGVANTARLDANAHLVVAGILKRPPHFSEPNYARDAHAAPITASGATLVPVALSLGFDDEGSITAGGSRARRRFFIAPQSSTGPRATPSATRTFSRPTPRCRP